MPIYKIRFEQLRQQPGLLDMLSALERGFQQFAIDFYLVGAVARDVWMQGIHKLTAGRTTKDIDFAVLINDKGVYEALKEYLIKEEGFQPYSGNAFVLLWKNGMQVDLLPFGGIEDEEGRVTVEGTGFTSVHVPGFSEVYEEGLPELELNEVHRFKFCTLPGIVVLKLIAWHDRPEARRSDIKDISNILHHFFDMYDNEIFDNHYDLFEGEKTDLKHIAATVMGREMKKIAQRNEKLYDRIQEILHINTTNLVDSPIGLIMTEHFNNTVEENIILLQHLRRGFTE
jgi:predicted nucleotidyltransferase